MRGGKRPGVGRPRQFCAQVHVDLSAQHIAQLQALMLACNINNRAEMVRLAIEAMHRNNVEGTYRGRQ